MVEKIKNFPQKTEKIELGGGGMAKMTQKIRIFRVFIEINLEWNTFVFQNKNIDFEKISFSENFFGHKANFSKNEDHKSKKWQRQKFLIENFFYRNQFRIVQNVFQNENLNLEKKSHNDFSLGT